MAVAFCRYTDSFGMKSEIVFPGNLPSLFNKCRQAGELHQTEGGLDIGHFIVESDPVYFPVIVITQRFDPLD